MPRANRVGWVALIAMLSGAPSILSAQGTPPTCPVISGPLIAGCTNAFVTGRVEPSQSNSPGEPTLSFLGQEYLYGFSQAGDEAFWLGKYVADANASASPGVLRTSAAVSGRYEPDLLDRPRVANAYSQAAAWYYDRVTITVAGAPFGQDALIHASLLPVGRFAQLYDNLKGPGDGYPLNPRGLFGFDLGASQFQSSDPTQSADDYGRISLNVQFNTQGIAGYHVQHASRSSEATRFEAIVGDPFGQPVDVVIRFKSGVPFYLKARSSLSVSLEMTTAPPTLVQPLGSISDLDGAFGNSIYWNGLSDAKVNGEPREFTVTSMSGADWSTSMVPLPEPQISPLLIVGLGIIGMRIRSLRRTGSELERLDFRRVNSH
jgi:hypothetical protein